MLGGERRGLVEPGARRGWYVDGRRLRVVPGLWTMKEALVKSYGTGPLLDPTSFEMPAAVRRGATSGRRVDGPGNGCFAAALAPDAAAVPAGSGQPAR